MHLALRRLRRGGALAALLGVCLWLTSACGSGSGSPLFPETQQEGMMECTPAPTPAAGLTSWNTPIGIAFGM